MFGFVVPSMSLRVGNFGCRLSAGSIRPNQTPVRDKTPVNHTGLGVFLDKIGGHFGISATVLGPGNAVTVL